MDEKWNDNEEEEEWSDNDEDDEYDDDSSIESVDETSFIKQHSIAIIIALIGTVVAFVHTSSNEIFPRKRTYNIRNNRFPKGYHRTMGLNFCQEDKINKRDDLDRFDFHLPKELIPTMLRFYEEDEKADINLQLNRSRSHECLIELKDSTSLSYVKGFAWAYISPDISTFYKSNEKMKPAYKSFTSFGVKFYNLSPEPLDLWWDGRKPRKISTVEPFESVGTTTYPGNSFSFAKTYDRDSTLRRWTVAADEAVLEYDSIKDNLKDLSPQQRYMYRSQKLNSAFERDYIIKTGRSWLSHFPRPPPIHKMHPAQYFGQRIRIKTEQTHFNSLPTNLRKLGFDEYDTLPTVSHVDHRKPGMLDLDLNVISCAPRVYEIENFLSHVEVEHIIQLSTNLTFHTSTVGRILREDRGGEDKSIRSSTNAWVYRETSPIIDAIYRRAADVMKVNENLLRHHDETDLPEHHSLAEASQLVHYEKEQHYYPHHDFHYSNVLNRYQPVRFATLLMFLNEDFEGGETVFPQSITKDRHDGIQVIPKLGKAVLFYNVLPDGNVDDLSIHGSNKITHGEKRAANLWLWDPIIA